MAHPVRLRSGHHIKTPMKPLKPPTSTVRVLCRLLTRSRTQADSMRHNSALNAFCIVGAVPQRSASPRATILRFLDADERSGHHIKTPMKPLKPPTSTVRVLCRLLTRSRTQADSMRHNSALNAFCIVGAVPQRIASPRATILRFPDADKRSGHPCLILLLLTRVLTAAE